MNNGGEAAEQVVRITLDGVDYAIRIAGTGAKNLASLIMAAAKSKKANTNGLRITGQERLKRMLKSGVPLDVFPVREQDMKVFSQESKKYGIVYCAVREKAPKADGMIDVLVRKEDSPKINRVMERLQYAAVNKAAIKSEIVRSKAERSAEQSAPEQSDNLDVDSFLDEILPDEGKSKEGQNQAVQTSAPKKSEPEVERESFFLGARAKSNPSAPFYEKSNGTAGTMDERPSVKEEIRQIRSELKEQEQSREKEPQHGKSAQQTTRHKQPQNTRKPKSRTPKGEIML